MTKTVISVEHLTKKYDLGVIGTGTLTRDLNRWWARVRHHPDPYTKIGQEDSFKRYGESILALDDVSFTVQQGEALGIIGRNGAGKSTLLKILSRVTAPTSGEVKVRGRIGSLLEVGTGFHPELTGRENIFLNGAILGMRKEEVASKFDEIVAFSGVEKFIDTPVKRYSSGMYVRLAFAVAAHLDPEILIVDEVLAVGDAEFQKKCLGKMGDLSGEGRTVLFVSHNMTVIQNLCIRAVHLDNGCISNIGETESVITGYLTISKESNKFFPNEDERLGDHRIKIKDFSITPSHPRTGKPLKCILDIQVDDKVKGNITANYSISFMTERGFKIFQLHSGHMVKGITVKPGRVKIAAEIDSLPLTPGQYSINLWVGSGNKSIQDWIPEAYTLEVESGSIKKGILIDNRGYPVVMQSKWSITHE
jgi:lipopolysaccharide transport system ATP-binding protein